VELRSQLAVLRQHLALILVGTILAALVAFLLSSILPRTYEGQATLLVGQSLSNINPDFNQLQVSQQLSQTYADVATTRPLLQKVIDQLGLDTTPDELAARVTATAPQNSTLIRIVADDGNADRSADIANAVAKELEAESPAIQGRQADVLNFVDDNLRSTQQDIQSTQSQIAALVANANRTAVEDQQLQVLQARLVTLRQTYSALLAFSSSSAPNLLSVIEPAVAPTSPSSPKVALYTLLAGVLGFLVMVGLAFARTALDDTIRTPEAVEEVIGLPTLGQIGRLKGAPSVSDGRLLTALRTPRSVVAEAFRTLRTNVDFSAVDAPVRTLLVTSSMPGEGKTIVAANLAVVFAQTGRRVILLDADLRKPGAHRMFGLPNAKGLTNLLRADRVPLAGVLNDTDQPLLKVLTSGPLPPNPAELLNSQRMEKTIARLQSEADILIVDSPPIQLVTDAAILASRLDGTLFVIEAGRVRRGAVRRAREVLGASGAHVLGVVLNRLPRERSSDYVGYYAGALGPNVPAPAAELGSESGPRAG
jgi:non-specific protein-tyrosine kinase